MEVRSLAAKTGAAVGVYEHNSKHMEMLRRGQ